MGVATGARNVLGMDVGKRSHWACLVDPGGTKVASRAVPNDREALESLFGSVPGDTLVVVDQARNIGALAVRCARERGLEVAYLPGIAAHNAAKLFAGDAKNDERDAWVIARTAQGIPDALANVPAGDATSEAARQYGAQIEFLTSECTRIRNRIRGTLLDTHPDFEAGLDLGDSRELAVMAAWGGPHGILAAGKAAFGAKTKGGDRAKMDAFWSVCQHCQRLDPRMESAQDRCIMSLASALLCDLDAREELDMELTTLLEGDDTYRCLLTVPGIGPKTAATLVACVDIAKFAGHDQLASYCGLAPADRQSGTSIRSVHASRHGNRRLKNLLVFSCNSITGSKNRYGAYYRRKRDEGKRHNDALKATARYRMKAIYAIMRDRVPYAEAKEA